MLSNTYRLADVDGTLCVVCAMPAWSEPELIHNFWPTKTRTLDLMRTYFDPPDCDDKSLWAELLSHFKVVQSIPGEYAIDPGVHSRMYGNYVWLVNGGRTEPIKTEKTPAPRPRTPLELKWENGRYWKNMKAGWKPA